MYVCHVRVLESSVVYSFGYYYYYFKCAEMRLELGGVC